MSELLSYPLQDNYESILSQSLSASASDLTIYVQTTPDFTFPASTTTYAVINPKKSNMELVKISAYDASAGTLTVASGGRAQPLYAGHSATEQAHAINSKILITDSYSFWKDIETAILSKVNNTGDTLEGHFFFTDDDEGVTFRVPSMTTTKRDLIAAPANGMLIYNSTSGTMQVYDGGAWANIDTGTPAVANASTTVAGIVEEATLAEQALGIATGATGARLFVNPDGTQEVSNHANDTTYLSIEYLDDATIQSLWTEAGDSGNPVVDSLDYMSYVGGYYRSAKFPWTFGGGVGSWVGTPAAPQDLSALTSAATGASTTGKVYFWAKTDDHTLVTYIHLRVGSSASDYVTSPALTFSASDTWELKSFSLNGLIVTGTPDWTALNYTFMQVNETGSGSIWISNIWFASDQEDWGKIARVKSNDFLDAGMIQKATATQSGVFEAATDTEIARGVGQNAAFN